ncbi:MAG: MMPL family transporter [Bacteroidales bacterium]|nr:MMPL family transporter [Bacteroidales bacterium]
MKIEKINKWFEKRAVGIIKYRWLHLFIYLLILLFGIAGLKRINVSTSWDDYFLEDDPVLLKTEEFKEIFGNDNFVAVLTRCDNTFTKENLELIRDLSNELLDSISYADKITSITDIEFMHGTETGMQIEQIVPEKIPSDAEGLQDIRNKAYLKKNIAKRLISSDGKLSWIVLKLRTFPETAEWQKDKNSVSPEMLTGKQTHHIISKEKYASISPLGTGMPYLSDRKMEWFGREGSKTMIIATILAIIVLIFATKSFRGVVVPIITAASAIIIVYGTLGFLRYKMDSSMMSVPVLVAFAIAIAYNIHIFSYFKRQFQIHGKRERAIVETIAEMGWPILFSGLTTLTALLSFLVIPVIPLHFIGIATASSVLVTLSMVLVIMSIILSFGSDKQPHPIVQTKGGRWLDRQLEKIGPKVLNNRKPILWTSVIIAAILIYGTTKIETAFDLENTMGRKIPYVDNLLKVSESELGSIYSYDVLVDFDQAGKAKLPENLYKLEKLSEFVHKFPLTKRTNSILEIIKDLNQTLNENKESYYTIPKDENQIAQMLLLYENAGGTEAEYWMDYDYQKLRLMVELETYNSQEAENNLAELTEFANNLFSDAKVTTVGSLPQFTAMMQYVVRGQINSFGIALIIIAFLLMIVFGSVRIGLIGLIPNIAPAITVGGIMGWMGMPLDMMTATIIPMILGLAVDDTIHFINHGHLEFQRTRNYKLAIKRTFFVVGTPLVLTTIIISSNFGVYITSNGKSILNMGVLAVSGMLAALLADLLITPILFERFKIFGEEENNNKSKKYNKEEKAHVNNINKEELSEITVN